MSDYSEILNVNRLRKSSVSGRTIVTESESDRGRILFCAAFRRLQQKAQVFSMEPNAAVRSRLTHSLEVAQVGRYIADEVGARLENNNLAHPVERAALGNFVEAACLMHDIGNPPFGHFGEAAIQKWFKDKGCTALTKALTLDRGELGSGDPRLVNALADFEGFDGNPQGLRVVTRLQWNTDEYGLNLTKTTLASYLKYTREAGEPAVGVFAKKAGYFSTEAGIVRDIRQELSRGLATRFPLAYIMEAADDIAYCISDLEDSIEKGIVLQVAALKSILERFEEKAIDDSSSGEIKNIITWAMEGKGPHGKEFTYTDFRTSLNRLIVVYVANRYIGKHAEILSGELDSLLPRESSVGAILDSLKEYCRDKVYCHESIQKTELAGYTAISGLLDHFGPLLSISRSRFDCALKYENKDIEGNSIVIEKKLLKLFPEKYKKVYNFHTFSIGGSEADKFTEWNVRAHLVVDFISGMTDDFAMTTYRTLAGMRL